MFYIHMIMLTASWPYDFYDFHYRGLHLNIHGTEIYSSCLSTINTLSEMNQSADPGQW